MNIANFAEPPDRPRKTSLQKLQEDLDRQMNPFREIEKLHEQLRPFRQLQEIQDQISRYSPQQQLRDLLKDFGGSNLIRDMLAQDPAAMQVQSLMEKYFPKTSAFGPFGPETDTFRKALGLNDASSLAARALEDALPKASAHDRLLEQMQRQLQGGHSIGDLAQQMELVNPAFSAIEAARQSIDSIFGSFQDIDFSAYEAPDEADLQAAEEQVESISQAAVDKANFQAAVEQIATAVASQPNPFVRLFLWVHFRTLLNHIYAGIVGTAISVAVASCMGPSNSSKSPQEATKNVKEAARAVVTVSDVLADRRYISAKVIAVHVNPKAKSPKLGRLKFGNVVRVIKKEKDFTLVVWSDRESGVEIQGWVFSRYLGKFN